MKSGGLRIKGRIYRPRSLFFDGETLSVSFDFADGEHYLEVRNIRSVGGLIGHLEQHPDLDSLAWEAPTKEQRRAHLRLVKADSP